MEILDKLKEDIRGELEGVSLVIGWEQGYDSLHATPLFIRCPEDIDRLIWNPLCVHNLASYLPWFKGRRVGILVKGCDSRTVIQLLQERLIKREEVVIFGIPCQGVVDLAKIRARVDCSQVRGVSFKGDKIAIETPQGQRELPLEEILATKCISCQYPTPLIYDHLAGEAISSHRPPELLFAEVEKIEKLDPKERFAYWQQELQRCIRCYACRNACPLCVCQDFCAADARDPHWLSQKTGIGEKFMWQILHAIHLAGRCTDCGECERACPMDIPIQRIRKKINKEIKELFGYEAGVNLEVTPPLYTFQVEEPAIKEREW